MKTNKLNYISKQFNSISPPKSISNEEFLQIQQKLRPLERREEFNFDKITSPKYNKSIINAIKMLIEFTPNQAHYYESIFDFLKTNIAKYFT